VSLRRVWRLTRRRSCTMSQAPSWTQEGLQDRLGRPVRCCLLSRLHPSTNPPFTRVGHPTSSNRTFFAPSSPFAPPLSTPPAPPPISLSSLVQERRTSSGATRPARLACPQKALRASSKSTRLRRASCVRMSFLVERRGVGLFMLRSGGRIRCWWAARDRSGRRERMISGRCVYSSATVYAHADVSTHIVWTLAMC
jgi:hypothetical protein